ncbi:MAG: hypothetical protein R3F59_01485 [Myxococcota bacterium]
MDAWIDGADAGLDFYSLYAFGYVDPGDSVRGCCSPSWRSCSRHGAALPR